MPVASLLEAATRCPLTRSAGNALSVVSWVMGTANRVKGRAVVILSVDATHLLMAREDSDVVGMKAVPQTPQGPRLGNKGWQFKCATSQMHRNLKKKPNMEPKTCQKGPKVGSEYWPTFKTSHCVRTACALRAWHSPSPLSTNQAEWRHPGKVTHRRKGATCLSANWAGRCTKRTKL